MALAWRAFSRSRTDLPVVVMACLRAGARPCPRPQDITELKATALGRFPADFQPDIRAELNGRLGQTPSPATA
jgi:hypothetical protein